eukprot:TRINITY_DN8640_c0_g1_i1.p1 TRINITY_DN8640_c0_g1~~TRINITY_DN8640_c0_g1_i1.p1  ORF type:complete len:120 (-),score=32.06 TRINITY_DN8640_c0_g1_i1:17-376(-)
MTSALGLDDACSAKMAPIGFVLGGKTFELTAEDYLERDESDSEACRVLLAPSFADSPATNGAPAFVLGYPFLRKIHAILDLDSSQVGFAAAAAAASGATAAGSEAAKGIVSVRLQGLRH